MSRENCIFEIYLKAWRTQFFLAVYYLWKQWSYLKRIIRQVRENFEKRLLASRYLRDCLSVRLPMFPSVRLPMFRLSAYVSVRPSAYVSVRLPTFPSVRLPMCPSVRLPMFRPSVCLCSVRPSAYVPSVRLPMFRLSVCNNSAPTERIFKKFDI